ncbi:MAG: sulfatase-like hydrolase/transferase [Planctomycetes bacterium]|nr:sulfatase-like hydrolase/transferase [Planctomycetota bacterium]
MISFYAPPKYHVMYDDRLKMPKLNESDWDDLPSGAKKLMSKTKWFWRGMQKVDKSYPGSYRKFIQSYAACSTFADASVKRLLDGLKRTPFAANTIIILWSDHGFHLGEKEHLEKFALWEKANHIPFIIVDPREKNTHGKVCSQPIDMTTIFPTLIDLCALPKYEALHGKSAMELVKNPEREWKEPAFMTYGYKNHALRSKRWRYIRYADGSEELYDHESDPNEWLNLASLPEHREIIAEFRKSIPQDNAKAFRNISH